MELKTMEAAMLEERKAQILEEIEAPEADLNALEEEIRTINEELKARAEAAAKKAELRQAIADGKKGEVIVDMKEKMEERKVTDVKELRASQEYKAAYGNYMKSILLGTPDDSECRSLLSKNAPSNGQIPVPVSIEARIQTAWENDNILSRVDKKYISGNRQIPFEISSTPAVVHEEGANAPDPEELEIGIATLIPKNIKKWILISDEVVDLNGAEFLDYIYDELTYRIVQKLRNLVIGDIAALPQTATATSPQAAKITGAPSLTILSDAADQLSDEATDIAIIMNRLTRSAFVAAQVAGNFNFDPFIDLPVLFTSALPAYSAAAAGDVYAIVGDLKGVEVNYPKGEDVLIKWDDISRSEADMIKVVGRQFAAHGVKASDRFTLIAKGS